MVSPRARPRAKKQPPPKPKTTDDVEKFLAELEKETGGGWRVCYPKLMTAEQGAVLTGLEDRSILASGTVGPSETYTFQSVAPESEKSRQIRGLLVGHRGLEPRTNGLRVRCSTN